MQETLEREVVEGSDENSSAEQVSRRVVFGVPVDAVARRPELVVVPLTALILVASLLAYPVTADGTRFRAAGVGMLGHGFFDVFSNDWLQIGPLYLLVLGVGAVAVRGLLSPTATEIVFAALQGAVVVWLAMSTARRAARRTGADELAARWATGLVLGAGGVVWLASEWAHPEEVFLGLLVVESGLLVGSGRAGRGGVVLGLAFAVKQWAVLGGGVLLLGRTSRAASRAIVGAVVVGVVAYVPFFVFGTVNTFHHHWGFLTSTPLGWLAAHAGVNEWIVRLLQGAVAGGVGLLAGLRRGATAPFVALTVICTRVLLDPFQLSYYVCPVIAVLTIWLWSRRDVGHRVKVAVCGAAPLLVYGESLVPHAVFWSVASVALVVVVAWTWRVEGRCRDGAVAVPTRPLVRWP